MNPEDLTNMSIWRFFNDAKVIAVNTLNFDYDQRVAMKAECDDLFKQATGNPICPAWYLNGF